MEHITSSRRQGKNETGQRRTPHQQVMSKLERRNQARQRLQIRHHQHLQAQSIFSGHGRAQRRIILVPLGEEIDLLAVISSLNASIDVNDTITFEKDFMNVTIERFKQQVQYLMVQPELTSVLDACRLADFVVLVLPPEVHVDYRKEQMVRAMEGQGITNVIAMVQVC